MKKVLWIGLVAVAILLPMQVLGAGLFPAAFEKVSTSVSYACSLKTGESAAMGTLSVDVKEWTLGNNSKIAISGDLNAIIRESEEPTVGIGASLSLADKSDRGFRAGVGYMPGGMGFTAYAGLKGLVTF
jgi:hypothetical protein